MGRGPKVSRGSRDSRTLGFREVSSRLGLGFRVWGLGFRVKGLGFRALHPKTPHLNLRSRDPKRQTLNPLHNKGK